MTFNELKAQTSMLLTSENKLPKDDVIVKASLKFAYIELADMATPLRWLTLSKDYGIMRQGPGDYLVRMPEMPIDDTDELDIDSELVPAVARMIASYIVKDIRLKQYHRSLAEQLMKRYDSKVRAFILSEEQKGAYVGIADNTVGQDGTISNATNTVPASSNPFTQK